MKSYSMTSLSLNQKDAKELAALRKQGHKLIDIFRAGMADVKARQPKKLFK